MIFHVFFPPLSEFLPFPSLGVELGPRAWGVGALTAITANPGAEANGKVIIHEYTTLAAMSLASLDLLGVLGQNIYEICNKTT